MKLRSEFKPSPPAATPQGVGRREMSRGGKKYLRRRKAELRRAYSGVNLEKALEELKIQFFRK